MKVAIVRETAPNERRVALVPEAIRPVPETVHPSRTPTSPPLA
jgi:alanine dehydrogenase